MVSVRSRYTRAWMDPQEDIRRQYQEDACWTKIELRPNPRPAVRPCEEALHHIEVEATVASKDWRNMLAKQKDLYPPAILSQMIRFILKLDREMDDNLG